MRIIFLGDSLTWGGYGGDFVAEIAARKPEHDIRNAGVGGNTVVNLLERLDEVLAEEPDGVFVMVGGNDAISYLYPETRPYYRGAQHIPQGYVSPEAFARTYRDLLTEIQLNQALAWVGLAPTEYNPDLVATKQYYNERAREVAQALNVPVLDLAAHFIPDEVPDNPPITLGFINTIGKRVSTGWDDYEAERQRRGFTYTFDGMHLTPESAIEFADLIIDFLKL